MCSMRRHRFTGDSAPGSGRAPAAGFRETGLPQRARAPAVLRARGTEEPLRAVVSAACREWLGAAAAVSAAAILPAVLRAATGSSGEAVASLSAARQQRQYDTTRRWLSRF
jgi:hypothetical protein